MQTMLWRCYLSGTIKKLESALLLFNALMPLPIKTFKRKYNFAYINNISLPKNRQQALLNLKSFYGNLLE